MNDEIRYPCAACSSIMSNPARCTISVAATNCAVTASMSARFISLGIAFHGDHGIGDADITGQLPSNSGVSSSSQPSWVEPLRPEWPT